MQLLSFSRGKASRCSRELKRRVILFFCDFAHSLSNSTRWSSRAFWRIYIFSLITSQLFGAPSYRPYISRAKSKFDRFISVATDNGFPVQARPFSIPSLVGWALSKLPRVRRVEGGVQPEGSLSLGVEFAEAGVKVAKTPIFVAEIHEALVRALESAGLRLWVMLDRLDEAFPRRSEVEKRALRALLSTTQAFKSEHLRLKVFLRDDIFSSVTDAPEGFVGLTHVMSRCSPVLRGIGTRFCNSLRRGFLQRIRS